MLERNRRCIQDGVHRIDVIFHPEIELVIAVLVDRNTAAVSVATESLRMLIP